MDRQFGLLQAELRQRESPSSTSRNEPTHSSRRLRRSIALSSSGKSESLAPIQVFSPSTTSQRGAALSNERTSQAWKSEKAGWLVDG